MRRTSAWMRFGVTFAVACLLASGCEKKQEADWDKVAAAPAAPTLPAPRPEEGKTVEVEVAFPEVSALESPPVNIAVEVREEIEAEEEEPEVEAEEEKAPEPEPEPEPKAPELEPADALPPPPPPAAKAAPPQEQQDGFPRQMVVVEAQKRAATRAKRKAKSMYEDADDLGQAIKMNRLRRLDLHARKKGWVLDRPPEGADPKTMDWWTEWRDLSRTQKK